MLLGRARERQEIGHALARARSGVSATLALAGEPGIGKTALLDHAAREAAGMRLLRVRRRPRWRARWPCGPGTATNGSRSARPPSACWRPTPRRRRWRW